ncbi:sentrin-specific protease 8 [Asbolus verrucosus]|uniref:Sentrin-specific protease 8 n=1 Tax=Asbolus verrucosus TaxID=1661398 RepID=A0A482VK88_ASBVE|nr:sentrin-specific protease 8 [Asbolus verrucosus]
MNKDPIVLSYDESLLRKSDVDLLHGPYWLNDNIISFYFEYLKNTFKSAPYILFISPEVTQCIKIIPSSQMKVFLDPLESKSKQYIFFAFNDNERPQTVGGTHWSLLLFSRADKTVYHYDSSRGSNNEQAEHFARKLFAYFDIKGEFSEEVSLQQTNGYDCGIYLICNAEHLAKHLAAHHTTKNYYNSNEELCNSVSTMRYQIVNIIEKLRD